MNHQSDTPASFSSVPGHTRLFRRQPGGTYYLRAKVPLPIRPIIGKTEIRVSLKTKTLKEGLVRVKPESMRVDRLFAEAEAKLKGEIPTPAKLSREELAWIVADWFIKQEARSEQWIEEELPKVPEVEKRDIATDLQIDCAAINGSSEYGPHDANSYLRAFLHDEGARLGIEPGSEDFKRLAPLFRQAASENLMRQADRVLGNSAKPYDSRFAEYHATTLLPAPPRQTVAFGKFLDDFMAYQHREHTETTPLAYAMPIRILREIIGEKTPVHTITRNHLEEVCDALRNTPINMVQRYPNLSVRKAIEAAERANDSKRLKGRTASNYYVLIVAVFNYAVDEQLIAENPAKSRKLREIFKRVKKPKSQRARFTPEELQAIFNAPLFTGREDDDKGYATPGKIIPRRGRFWVPLIALFNGLRCNEACQLYSEDVREEDGIPYLHIRVDSEDEEETEKRVKTLSSWRKVPIHSELLKMGFLDYVAERQLDKSSPRLFPTLAISERTKRYSNVFSKWFGRFLTQACGYKPKATFHSFRHHFATELTNAGAPTPLIEKLGGWQPEGSSIMEYRHGDLPVLRETLENLKYPGLDFSHLWRPSVVIQK